MAAFKSPRVSYLAQSFILAATQETDLSKINRSAGVSSRVLLFARDHVSEVSSVRVSPSTERFISSDCLRAYKPLVVEKRGKTNNGNLEEGDELRRMRVRDVENRFVRDF